MISGPGSSTIVADDPRRRFHRDVPASEKPAPTPTVPAATPLATQMLALTTVGDRADGYDGGAGGLLLVHGELLLDSIESSHASGGLLPERKKE